MAFNPFVWQLFCASPSGKTAINTAFLRFARIGRSADGEGWRRQTNAKISVHLQTITHPEAQWELGGHISLREILSNWFDELDEPSAIEKTFRDLLEDVGASQTWEEDQHCGKQCHAFFGGDEEDDAQNVASAVGAISTTLHWLKPNDFVPYYFEGRFSLFAEICRTFGIVLRDIPGPLQKKERALYYLGVNSALQEFRHRNQLSHRELNAFLYVFAPRYLAVEQDKDLPEPQRVWFMMAGVGTTADFDFLDSAIDGTECNWRGNRDARRGDIAVMWCSSPRAYLHSIWRIVEDGYGDPFAYWYSMVRVGHPVPVSHLKIKDLKSNLVLAESPMVRAHFQGCADKYFRPVDYAALRDELEHRGNNLSSLAQIYVPALPVLPLDTEILDERQVELQLVEPLLLKKLGYDVDSHWQRQVRVRMGRGEKVYPDYLIGYRGVKGEERASIVVEAKYRIGTQKQLFETFLQGRSYALRLQASWLLLASLEGVWLLSRTDDFKLENALHWSWEKLVQPEHFAVLDKAVGCRAMALTN